jgi:hypothetical protein
MISRRVGVLAAGALVAALTAPTMVSAQARLPQEVMVRIAQNGTGACAEAERSTTIEDVRRKLAVLDNMVSQGQQLYKRAEEAQRTARRTLDDLRRQQRQRREERGRLQKDLERIRDSLRPVDQNIQEAVSNSARIRARLAELDATIAQKKAQLSRGSVYSDGLGGLSSGVEQRHIETALKDTEAELRKAETEKANLIRERMALAPEVGALIAASPRYRVFQQQERGVLDSMKRLDEQVRAAETVIRTAEKDLAAATATFELLYERGFIEERYYTEPVRSCLQKRIRELSVGPVVSGGGGPTTNVGRAQGRWRVLCPGAPASGGTPYEQAFGLDIDSAGQVTGTFATGDIMGGMSARGTLAADGTTQGSAGEPGQMLTWQGQLTRAGSGSGTVRFVLQNPTYSGTCDGKWWTSDQPRPSSF